MPPTLPPSLLPSLQRSLHPSLQNTVHPDLTSRRLQAKPLAAALLLACSLARAGGPDIDVGGAVVTSQSVTVAGHDFCQYFIAAWRDKDGSDRYPLAIRERPSARWGSEVTIEYAQRRVYRTQLPASRAAVRAIGEDAAESAYQAVQQADAERQLLQDADLAPDEF